MDELRSDMNMTIREEANALTALAFRNGFIEQLHAGRHHEVLDDPEISRITDDEMKTLMIQASERLAQLLHLRETNPEKYKKEIKFGARYSHNWDKTWPLSENTRNIEESPNKKFPDPVS